MGKIKILTAIVALASAVLILYHPVLGLNFYADDYSFVENAGRLSLGEYLRFYFDPRVQTGWYRPMQGLLFGIEWLAFGGNPLGYHAVNALTHLFNCLLLFAIVRRATESLRVAFVSALIWLGLPLYGVAVFWPGDADFLLTFFYLLAIYFWIRFLQEPKRRWQIFSFVAFLLALTTKEFGVTVPATLFLLDRFLLRDPASARARLARYAPFLAVYALYLPLELFIQSRSVLTNQFGYGVGAHLAQNVLGYLAALVFPWVMPEPINFIWLGIAALLLIYFCVAHKTVVPIVLSLIGVLAILPAAPFPWFLMRYLYGAAMVSAIFFAALTDRLARRFSTRWVAVAAVVAIASIVFSNGLGVASAVADFAEIGRQTRVPFRDFTQRHSTLPADSYIYFINPPTITSQLSGMFFLRYGASVHVASDDLAAHARLRDHVTSYVIYFDEEKRTREILADKNLAARSNLPAPMDFGEARLTGWELASDHAQRGAAIVLMLYWDAEAEAKVELIETATGQAIASSGGQARGAVADARVLLIPGDARPGTYRVEISVRGAAQKMTIEPIAVSE